MSLLSRNIIQFPLFAPNDATSGGNTGSPTIGGNTDMSREDMIDFMADDGEEDVIELEDKKTKGKTDKTTREKQSPTEEETTTDEETISEEGDEEENIDEELSELESELEGPTDEQLELVTPVRRREILKKYPNLFKDFPYLEKAYYREQQFTELLPTIEDAKVAVEKSQTLDRFESDVIQGGNTENILKAVKEENPNAFHKLVDNYLPTLAKVDERAYLHVLGNVSKHTILAMLQEAQRLGLGENGQGQVLQSAAHILNQFVFGSSEFKPPTNLAKDSPEGDKRVKEVEQREQQFVERQLNTSVEDLNSRVNNTLRNTINMHIDPKKTMTEYIRGKAQQDALDDLNRLLEQDTRFKNLADRLWEKVIETNFSRDAVERVKTAYLSKAKTLLPTVIKKARIEALKGMGRRVRESSDEEETTSKKGPITPGAPRSQRSSGGKITKATDIPKGMTSLEFLNSD